jgi:hypothetical protein
MTTAINLTTSNLLTKVNNKENLITTPLQLALTNCCQSSATAADLWQIHQHFYVPAQKYLNEQSLGSGSHSKVCVNNYDY